MTTEKKFLSKNGVQYVIVKSKRWYIEYYILHPCDVRERKRVYGQLNRIKDLKQRETRAIDIIGQIASGIWQNPDPEEDLTILGKVLKDIQPDLKKKSFSTYKTKLNIFELWLAGRHELKIGTSEANDFLHFLKRTGRHNTTVLAYKITLSTLYNKLNNGFNPFQDTIKIRKRSTSLMYFNPDQVKALKEYFITNDREAWIAIQLLYYCFIRPGEIRLLLLSDINLHESWIEVRAEISKNGKTQKVRIPRSFAGTLKKYLQSRQNKYGLVISKDPEGKIPVAEKHINTNHRKGLDALEIVGRYSFYSWKHTGAVHAVKAGINLKDLQMQLRHHSLDQVNEYLKDLGVLDSEDLRFNFPKI